MRQMRSDNGSNFVEAVKELRKSFQVMNHSKINEYLQMTKKIGLAGSTISQRQGAWVENERGRLELPEVLSTSWLEHAGKV